MSGHHLAESRHTGDGIETLGDTGCIIRDAAAGAEPHQNMQVTAADSLSHILYVQSVRGAAVEAGVMRCKCISVQPPTAGIVSP